MMGSNVHWLLDVAINEGELDAFKTLMKEMVEATQSNESGAMIYEWFISEDEKNCHMYERYVDSAAMMIHLGSFGANFAERFFAVVTLARFTVYGDPSSEVREALAGFGVVHMAEIGGFAR